MKKIAILLTLCFITITASQTFTTEDPPMIYIYHFVSYDPSFSHTYPAHEENEKNKVDSLRSGTQQQQLDPKLVSAMITTAVGRYEQVKIAGESMQSRLKSENIITMMKSYKYPEETDFIIIGEINVLAGHYEIDLKVMDVSRQDIINSEAFSLPFDSVDKLRVRIDGHINALLTRLLKPFTGLVYVRVDSTSRQKVRWKNFAIRPVHTMVGGQVVTTSDKDLEHYTTVGIDVQLIQDHFGMLAPYLPEDIGIIASPWLGGPDTPGIFLEGEYKARAYLKDNEEFFETTFTVIPGNLNEIHLSLEYIPPPIDRDGDGIQDKEDACPDLPGIMNEDPEKNGCPPPPPPPQFGDITVANIQDGVGYEVFHINEGSTYFAAKGMNSNGKITGYFPTATQGGIISSSDLTTTLKGVPLGSYRISAYALSEETFPGKQYLLMFSFIDTVALDVGGEHETIRIPDKRDNQGREIIVYFDPFSTTPEEEYRLYLEDSVAPFSIIRVVGEVHIVGFPVSFSGTIAVEREGFKRSVISVESGQSKLYKFADLTIPAVKEEQEKTKSKKLFKF
jgi:hypothetical protein|tara:strand:- start:60 stop:1748 length:1689 start_codon:yes stop_codon:yes gene_type:complete